MKNATRFHVVGVQKGGTTWLRQQLRRDKLIKLPIMKEINLYSCQQKGSVARETAQINKVAASIENKLAKGQVPNERRAQLKLEEMRRYLDILDGSKPYDHLFDGANNTIQCYGDVSPSMALLDTSQYEAILTENPNTKFIVCFRDPIQRLFSAFGMAVGVRGGIENIQNPVKVLNHLIKGQPGFGSLCHYDRTIQQMESAIPRENILYLFYENIFSDNSTEETNKIKQFLNLPNLNFDTQEVVNPTVRKNEADSLITPHIEKWARKALSQQYSFMSEKFKNELPDGWASAPTVKRTASAA